MVSYDSSGRPIGSLYQPDRSGTGLNRETAETLEMDRAVRTGYRGLNQLRRAVFIPAAGSGVPGPAAQATWPSGRISSAAAGAGWVRQRAVIVIRLAWSGAAAATAESAVRSSRTPWAGCMSSATRVRP